MGVNTELTFVVYIMKCNCLHLQAYEKLMKCPYFFFDVFYAHEVPSQKNECQVGCGSCDHCKGDHKVQR